MAKFAGIDRIYFYLWGCVGAIALLLYVAGVEARRTRNSWPQAPVRIVGERSVLTNVYESQYGGGLVFQGELKASYVAEGRHFMEWVPVLSASGDRALLDYKLHALASGNCSVRWEPGRPQDPVLEC